MSELHAVINKAATQIRVGHPTVDILFSSGKLMRIPVDAPVVEPVIDGLHTLIYETATQKCEATIPMFYALSEKYGNAVAFNFSCALQDPQPPEGFETFADYLEYLIQAERKIEAEDPIQF